MHHIKIKTEKPGEMILPSKFWPSKLFHIIVLLHW